MNAEINSHNIRNRKIVTNYGIDQAGEITGATQRSALSSFKPDFKCSLGEIYSKKRGRVSVFLSLKPTRSKDIDDIEILHDIKKDGSSNSFLRLHLSETKKTSRIIKELKLKGLDIGTDINKIYLDWDQNTQKFRVGGQNGLKGEKPFLTEPLLTIDDINVVDLEINPTHIYFGKNVFSFGFVRKNKLFDVSFKLRMPLYVDSSIKNNELLVPVQMQSRESHDYIQWVTGIPANRFLCTDHHPDLGGGVLYSMGSSGSYTDSIRFEADGTLSIWQEQNWVEANPKIIRAWAKRRLREINLERMKQMLNPAEDNKKEKKVVK